MIIYFTWDPNKAAANLNKHGIDFEVAERVFYDPHAIFEQDRVVDGEKRWQAIGMADGRVMLLVAHTQWEEDENGETVEIIRIISARRVEPHERRKYESQFR